MGHLKRQTPLNEPHYILVSPVLTTSHRITSLSFQGTGKQSIGPERKGRMNKLFPLPLAPDPHHEMLEYFTQQVKHKKCAAFMQGQRKKPPLIKATRGSGKGTKDLSDSGCSIP